MARLIFAMMQSLDGYVSSPESGPSLPLPDEKLGAHFNEEMARITGSLYGGRMYEIMRFWDSPEAEHDEGGRGFALAWRAKPKWVVSKTLKSVGPNATLVTSDLESFVRKLKAEHQGDVEVAGPTLAGGLTALGLIDEYQLYIQPVVLGGGKPFFSASRPPLRLVSSEEIGGTVRLRYVPA